MINMHTLVEVNSGNVSAQGTHVPAFLAKLWKLVDDQTTNDLIYWSDTGNSFIIQNQAKFARDLLPLYYKHNNMASFVRQLNMYGFHKVVSVEQGGLKLDKDEMEFAHPFFLRGHESSLELIKRKIPAAKHDEARIRPDNLQKVLMDVRQMKGKQENMDTKLLTMKRENEALWRELAALRQKHANQTTILSKILQFLVGMMSSPRSHRLGFKRRMPLMLNDTDETKDRKISRHQGQQARGPLIRDVTEIFEAEDSSDEQDHSDYITGSSGSDGDNHPKVESPQSAPSKSPYTESILGLSSDERPEMMLSVDPASVNPSMSRVSGSPNPQTTQNIQAKSKGKSTAKKTVAPSANSVTFPAEIMNLSMPQVDQEVQNQFQDVTLTPVNQGNTETPTAYYLTGVGSEPVQVFLSIPDKSNISTADIGVNTEAVSITTPTTTVSQPQTSPMDQAQTVNTTSTDMVPIGSSTRNQNMSSKYAPKVKVTEDFDAHLDDMQVGLENLKELLKSEEYKMDNSTLLGLFGEGGELAGLDLAKHLQDPALTDGAGSGETGLPGQELVSYNPSLFELTEDDSQFFDDSSNMFLDDELESMLTTEREKLNKAQAAQGGSLDLSFSSALNGQGVPNNGSGLSTPIGSTSTSILASSLANVPTTNITGAGKRKRK